MTRFVRVSKEVDKDAMRRDPAAVAACPGVRIGSAGETFSVTPYETKLEEVAYPHVAAMGTAEAEDHAAGAAT